MRFLVALLLKLSNNVDNVCWRTCNCHESPGILGNYRNCSSEQRRGMSKTQQESLAGRVALVTGAARRIGAEIASSLHTAGARVAVHYRGSASDAEALCAKLNTLRAGSAIALQADLVAENGPESLIESFLDWSGQLDILVNNASSFYPTPLGEIQADDWNDLVGTNLRAPLFLAQAAAPYLRAAGGNIVNIVDIHARRPLRDHHVYGAAKAGLVMLTRSLAKELAPQVRVNGVAPGAIAWPEGGMTESVKKSIIDQIPLGRTGKPADIANAVLFLVRDATFVTGQIVPIDGGRSIGW
jgi:pteridine reductase